MRLLREERGYSRLKAIVFGVRVRSFKVGRLVSLWQAASIVAMDSFRSVALRVLRYGLFLPLMFLRRVVSKTRPTATATTD